MTPRSQDRTRPRKEEGGGVRLRVGVKSTNQKSQSLCCQSPTKGPRISIERNDEIKDEGQESDPGLYQSY